MPFYLGHLKQYSCHTGRYLTFLQPIVRGITGEPDRPPDNRPTFFSGKTDSAVFTISLKCAIIEYEEKGMRKFVILVCAFSALTMACKIASAKKEAYTVKQGLYDIGDLGASEIADLEGEWIFVPEKHVPPAEIFTGYNRFEKINYNWNKYKDPMPIYGCATYGIKIKNFFEDKVYAIKVAEVSSAVTLYLDGVEFFRTGKAAETRSGEQLDWNSNIVILPLNGRTKAELVFHVSNFSDRLPGFHRPIQIGFYSTLSETNAKSIVVSTITAGILFLLFVFFISLFIFYPKDKKSLYFSLLCFTFCLRVFCYDEYLLAVIIPQINRMAMHKIGFVTFSAALIFATLFIHELFGKISKKLLYALLAPGMLYILINIIAPLRISLMLLMYAQIYMFTIVFYNIYIIGAAAIKKDISSILFLSGLSVFGVLIIRDVLISNGIVEGVFLSQFGIFMLLIPMTLIVLNHFKFTFENTLMMTNKIETVNNALEKFLPAEFMNFLNKKHVDVCLGDNNLKEMYIAFVYIGLHAELKTDAERLTLLEIYNHILANINPIIKRHGGVIDKYLTEGLMILFSENADNAVACMLEIHSFIERENIQRNTEGIPKINFACGVHYGRVMLGTIGEAERMDNTVISDVVNIASRLHFYALQHGSGIFISETVKNNFHAGFLKDIILKDIGFVKLRGKEQSVLVYEVKQR